MLKRNESVSKKLNFKQDKFYLRNSNALNKGMNPHFLHHRQISWQKWFEGYCRLLPFEINFDLQTLNYLP